MNSLLRQGMNSGMNMNMDLPTALNAVKKNPIQFLINSKFNVPNNIGNNPQSIVQYLINSGQVTQQQVEQIKRTIGL